MSPEAEADAILSFIEPSKRERWREGLAAPKKRRKLLDRLYHEHDLDRSLMFPIPHAERLAISVHETLRKLGAPVECRIFSANSALDGRNMPLLDALESIVDYHPGTILACVPGKLGYYLSEERNGQYLLHVFVDP